MNRIDETTATEYAPHKFSAFASDLGIAPDDDMPDQLSTSFGNFRPFMLDGETPVCAMYKQEFGCITLIVYYD